MTKDEITNCVHKNVDGAIKKNMDIVIKSITDFLVSLTTANSASSDTDARLKSAADIAKVLYGDVVEQSVFTTIHTLFDLGLLTQDKPEE